MGHLYVAFYRGFAIGLKRPFLSEIRGNKAFLIKFINRQPIPPLLRQITICHIIDTQLACTLRDAGKNTSLCAVLSSSSSSPSSPASKQGKWVNRGKTGATRKLGKRWAKPGQKQGKQGNWGKKWGKTGATTGQAGETGQKQGKRRQTSGKNGAKLTRYAPQRQIDGACRDSLFFFFPAGHFS